MTAARDEAGIGEPRGDLVRLVAVEVEELDAFEAHLRHLAQRRLERAGALAPHGPEHQADTGHVVPPAGLRRSRGTSSSSTSARARAWRSRRRRSRIASRSRATTRSCRAATRRSSRGSARRRRSRARRRRGAREVRLALRIQHRAVVKPDVAECGSVLGDVDRRGCVVAATRARHAWNPSGLTSQPMSVYVAPGMCAIPGNPLSVALGLGQDAEVVVHAEEVDRRGDRLEVARLTGGAYGRSSGYSPRNSGSRNQRFRLPSMRRADLDCSGEVSAGSTWARFSVMPTSAPGERLRSTGSAQPCERRR